MNREESAAERSAALDYVRRHSDLEADRAWIRFITAEIENLKNKQIDADGRRDAIANQIIGLRNLLKEVQQHKAGN